MLHSFRFRRGLRCRCAVFSFTTEAACEDAAAVSRAAAVFKKQKTPQQVVVETTWNTVVVGEIVDCYPHPQADRLNVCKVNIGDKENLLQIICGAFKVRASQWRKKKLKIKKSKLRGEVSQGMICSETELGLADESDGIFICEADAQVGSLVFEHDTIASRLKARGISVPSPQLKVAAAPLQTETEQ